MRALTGTMQDMDIEPAGEVEVRVTFTVDRYPHYPVRTATLPVTPYTVAHPDLLRKLGSYPWLPRGHGRRVPEALFAVLHELAAGRALSAEALTAARVLLELDPQPEGDAEDFCPSCFSPVRDGRAWEENMPPEDELGYRWTSGSGPGGWDTCGACVHSPGAWEGVLRTGYGTTDRLPRYMVHPSEWDQRGFRPDGRL